MSLKTDFFTVAQSGPTVDGREIKKQWLKDAADTYSQDQHLSKIWPEHMRWMPMGEISDVRYTKAGDLGHLEARISPNDDLIYYVRQGRMNQPSIEIIEQFAGSEKAYLYGLGATSSPASLGVGKMPVLFNTQDEAGKAAVDLFTQRIALDANAPSSNVHIFASPMQWEDLEFKKEKSIFDLGRFFKRDETPIQPEEAIDMKKDELLEVLQEFKTELKTELKQEFSAPAVEPEVEVEAPEAEVTDEAETVPLSQFNELQKEHEDFKEKVETFMNSEEPQPDAPEHGTTETDDVWSWK